MRNLKKVMAMTLSTVMTASLLTGCGGNSQETTTAAPVGTTTAQAEKGETTAAKAEDSEPVTLRVSWWGGDSRHERLLALIEEFQKENPNIRIEPEYSAFADYRDKFTMQLTSGAAADIMAVDQPWVASIIGQGDFFVDLSQYEDLDLGGFDSYVMDNFCKFDNGTFFIPAGVNGMGSLVDVDKLAEFGFDLSNRDFTWDDLITLGEKVQAASPEQYLCCVDSKQCGLYYARTYLRQLTGKQFINDDGTVGVTKEELTEALAFVNTLYEKKIFQPIEESGIYNDTMTQNPGWINRDMFMILGRTSVMTDASARRKDEGGNPTTTGFVLPQLKDGKESGIEVRPAALYAINKTCANPDAAARFLSFVFNSEKGAETLKDTYSVPAREDLREFCNSKQLLDQSAVENVAYSLENSGSVVNAWSNNAEGEAMMTEIMQKIAYRQYGSMEEAADEVISRIEQIAAASPAK